jgi:hypothetical protein
MLTLEEDKATLLVTAPLTVTLSFGPFVEPVKVRTLLALVAVKPPINEVLLKDPKEESGLAPAILLAKISATCVLVKSAAAVKVKPPIVAVSPAFNLFRLTVCRASTPSVPAEPASTMLTLEEDKYALLLVIEPELPLTDIAYCCP